VNTFRKILRTQKGDSTITNIAIVAGLILIAFLCWKLGIPLVKNMILSDYTRKQVNYDSENYQLDATMLNSMSSKVLNKAIDLKLPVTDRDIKIDQEGNKAIMVVKYKYPVNLIFFEFNWNFEITRRSEGIAINLDD
jgi:hypothetical protein